MIRTKSWRLALAARLARLVPPGFSGVFLRLYPPRLAQRERAAFTARSSLANVEFQCDRPDWVANSFAIRGFYEWAIVNIANSICRPGDTIIEVGANIGTESLLYAAIVGPAGRVASFEPFPDNLRMLRRQLDLNRLTHVDVFPNAVSDQQGTLHFVAPVDEGNFGQGHLADPGAASPAGGKTIDVECVRLDDLFAAGQLLAPRLLVIDVQGAELGVLRGGREMIRAARPYLVLEVDPEFLVGQGLSVEAVQKMLEEWGYRAWSISKWGLRPARTDITHDANWLCIPSQDGDAVARRVSRRLWWSAVLPLIPGLSPAVIRPHAPH